MSDNNKLTDEDLKAVGLLGDASTDSNPTVDGTVDKEVYHGADAIAQVESNLGRPLTYAEKRVVEEEGYVATPYTDTKGITTQGVGQTGQWIEAGFEAAFAHHVDRTRNRIPNLDEYPEDLQAELIQAEYRGDLGHSPTFLSLFNQGNYAQASEEFLDNNDYRNSLVTNTGVHGRMKRVSDAVESYSEKRGAVPEAAPSTADYDIGDSGYKFVDGDTFRNKETNESIRFEGIDFAEVEKVLRDKGYVAGESGGQAAKQYVAYLANKYGFTEVKVQDKDAGYGRKLGDLVDKDGNSFQNFLISSGIAKPTFIGKTEKTMSDDDYSRYLHGLADRKIRGVDKDKSDIELASQIIKAASLETTGGSLVAKKRAMNEAEYALMPEFFTDVVIRNNMATLDNRAVHPFSQSWDSALTMVSNAFKQVGVMSVDITSFDKAEASLLGSIDYSRQQLADKPKVRLDYRDVDWTDLGEIGEFVGANLATSIPFMGVTIGSMVLSKFIGPAAFSIPVAMYSGMVLDEMPGEQDQKNYGVALVGGSIAAALDVFGVKGAGGLIKPSQFITKEGREKAIKLVMQSTGAARARAVEMLPSDKIGDALRVGLTREQAALALQKMTKRQIVSYANDVAEFAGTQLAKGAVVKRLASRITQGAAFEGSTEMLQELTMYTAAVIGSEKTWDFDELQHRMTNAVIAGGLMGAGFATPGGVWEAGQWRDASVAMSKYDGRFDDAADTFRSEARDSDTGRVADLNEIIEEEWADTTRPKSAPKPSPKAKTEPDDGKERVTAYDALGNMYEAVVVERSENGAVIVIDNEGNQVILGDSLTALDTDVKSKKYKLQSSGLKFNEKTISELDVDLDSILEQLKERIRTFPDGGAKQAALLDYNAIKNFQKGSFRADVDAEAEADVDAEAVEDVKFTDRADAGQETYDEKPSIDSLKDGLMDPAFTLRAARDTVFSIERLQKSKTLRRLYDMLGGKDNKVHHGIDFHSDKMLNFTSFERLIPEIRNLYSSFVLDSKRYGAKREALSALVYNFYDVHIKPITEKEGNNQTWITGDSVIAMIDWDNLKPEFQENSAALKDLIDRLYQVDRKMYEGVTLAQATANVPPIGDLQDHIFRSKSFLKSTISANKEKFINLLMAEKGLTVEEANGVTNTILDNPDVNTLDEAFDLTKGGITPKTHKRRSLDIADNEAFSEFFENNLFDNLENSMKSAARYMTMTKFVGPNSSLLTSMFDKIQREFTEGLEDGSADQLSAETDVNDIARLTRDLINADSGNYKRIESDVLRGTQKALTLTGVLTMLGLAAPMSIVEFALTPVGVDVETLNKNVGGLGMILGREFYEYFAEVGRLTGIAPQRSNFDTAIKSRDKRDTDVRFVEYNDPAGLGRRVGFGDARTGQAQLTGVTEFNKFTKNLMDSFFKVIGLNAVTNATRTIRASFYNDFLIKNLDILHQQKNEGTADTNETREARRFLEKMGIPPDIMLELSEELLAANGNPSPELQVKWERQFDNGLFNFINEAVPLPDAMGRPLFYSDPHYAMFTQFQGFISKFTAHHIPRLYDLVKNATPGFKYSTFATLMSMLLLGYAAQHLKDLIKFGESSPYLEDNDKYLRALYSSGLLGTTERVLSNNMLFPLYEDRSRTMGEAIWNFGTGEAPSSAIFENVYKLGHGLIEGDSRSIVKSSASLTPLMAPFKHRIYDAMVQAQWITGDDY